jgi:hypothetical protein
MKEWVIVFASVFSCQAMRLQDFFKLWKEVDADVHLLGRCSRLAS